MVRMNIAVVFMLFVGGCIGQDLHDGLVLSKETAAALPDDDAFMGQAGAPVTMVGFSDYQCVFCRRFFEETLPLIEENYVKTGKVRFVLRDFPLDMHPQAKKAAEAAECAKEQGMYWQMHDRLFEGQESLGLDSYLKWADELGLNASSFEECISSGRMSAEVSKDVADGDDAGVVAVPSFFINGRLIAGLRPYSVFKGRIEEAMNASF